MKYIKPKDGLTRNIIDAIAFVIGVSVIAHTLGIEALAGILLIVIGRNFNLGKLNISNKEETDNEKV